MEDQKGFEMAQVNLRELKALASAWDDSSSFKRANRWVSRRHAPTHPHSFLFLPLSPHSSSLSHCTLTPCQCEHFQNSKIINFIFKSFFFLIFLFLYFCFCCFIYIIFLLFLLLLLFSLVFYCFSIISLHTTKLLDCE